jgi:hypothetical protein
MGVGSWETGVGSWEFWELWELGVGSWELGVGSGSSSGFPEVKRTKQQDSLQLGIKGNFLNIT